MTSKRAEVDDEYYETAKQYANAKAVSRRKKGFYAQADQEAALIHAEASKGKSEE